MKYNYELVSWQGGESDDVPFAEIVTAASKISDPKIELCEYKVDDCTILIIYSGNSQNIEKLLETARNEADQLVRDHLQTEE